MQGWMARANGGGQDLRCRGMPHPKIARWSEPQERGDGSVSIRGRPRSPPSSATAAAAFAPGPREWPGRPSPRPRG